MVVKKTLFKAAAVALMAISSSSAFAGDRISVPEVHNFVTRLMNAVNNPDPTRGRVFLAQYLTENARMNNSIIHTGYVGGLDYRHPVWYERNIAAYYRYPNAYDPYFRPTSVRNMGKAEIIAQFENKKHMIPRYNQQISILSTRMPPDAQSAVIDVDVRETGLTYAYGYSPYYGTQALHNASTCQLFLLKDNNEVKIDSISCNSTGNGLL